MSSVQSRSPAPSFAGRDFSIAGRWLRPAEDRAASISVGLVAFVGDEGIDRRSGSVAFECSRLIVEAFQGAKLFVAAEPCMLDRALHDADRLVEDFQRHRE